MLRTLSLFVIVILLTINVASAHQTKASWYSLPGNKTASGEIMNPNAMTAAHKTLPFGTHVKVTYKGKSVVVKINDRGPYIHGREYDLSRGAAKNIGCSGVCEIDAEVL